MIEISKEESKIIRTKFPYAKITRTCRQKSKRHKYYMPEKTQYLSLIKDTNYLAAEILNDKNWRQEFDF